MIDHPLGDVVAHLRGSIGAPVSITVLRGAPAAEYALSMKRSRIIPTTVTYERRGDVALIHLTGFNSATTVELSTPPDIATAIRSDTRSHQRSRGRRHLQCLGHRPR